MVERNGLGVQGAREAESQVADADGIEPVRVDRDGLQHVAAPGLGRVARNAARSEGEGVVVEIYQRDARRRRGETAVIEEVAAADTDVQVIGRHVLIVVREEATGRALPNVTIRDPQYDDVVDGEDEAVVDRLPGVDFCGRRVHRVALRADRCALSWTCGRKPAANMRTIDSGVSTATSTLPSRASRARA